MHIHLRTGHRENTQKNALQVCRICLKSGKLFNCCVLACEAQCVAIKQRKNCDTCKDRRQNKAFWIKWIFYGWRWRREKKTTRNGMNTNTSENDHKIWKEKPLRRKGKTYKKSHIHTKETSAREKKRKELFMVCILHNINYAIKLPSTPFVSGQIVWRR